jgi:predicted short-subunit dehydrogenase-like oxidoreductase (DUF2520 family)
MNIKEAKICVIGAGNVGTRLALSFQAAGLQIVQVYSRTQRSALELASKLGTACTTDIKNLTPDADIYLICVPDIIIGPLSSKIPAKNKMLIHTAGSVDIKVLEHNGGLRGVFYPMQTFSKFKEIDFSQVPMFIEGSCQESEEVLYALSRLLSHKVYSINSEQRKSLHLAAVFACNFANHMYGIADDILRRSGMHFEILKPLIKETSDRIQKLAPRDCQTGPAVREDLDILEAHMALLDSDPVYKDLYRIASNSIIKLKAKP